MTAREEILARIRTELPVPPGDLSASQANIPRLYDQTGSRSRAAVLELFSDRLTDYDSTILEISATTELPEAIAHALALAGNQQFVAAPTFPREWLPPAIEATIDNDLSAEAIASAEAVVTTCEAAVASTGTILLVHEGAQGRRILTLLPDHHICLVQRSRVFELVPQALTAIADRKHLPLTTISGPSATSDIEMTRIRGVHGPRRLTVILHD